jgi:hypothetical protein
VTTPQATGSDPDATSARGRWLEIAVLAAILALAAVVRLPGLDARGQWDSDQGHDMGVLAAFVQHGQIPLLGPLTSIGTFHHGALYYYLLAPAALLSGADPVAVTAELALLGVAAVAATWWLGRVAGGKLTAAIAALLLAVSPAGISESTFIWNPNPIPLFAALASVGVLEARRTRRVRWWLLAAAGTMITMQLHWLGAVLAVPVAAAWALEVRGARRSGRSLGPLGRAGLAGFGIIFLGYLPLAVHEVTSGASELQAIAAYVGGGTGAEQTGLATRLLMVALRSLTWPVAGLLTDRVVASLVALAAVLTLAAVAVLSTDRGRRSAAGGDSGADGGGVERPGAGGAERHAGRWAVWWLAGAVAISVPVLAVLAPSLAVIVQGLPNDHYHNFLDPLILVLAGTGVAALAKGVRTASAPGRLAGQTAAVALTAVLVGIAVSGWPPAVSPDGGWRLADAAAGHVVEVADAGWPSGEPRLLASLPDFKPDDALRFPLERRGFPLEPAIAAPTTPGSVDVGVVTVVCDPLFDDATGFGCGGPAEDRWLAGAYPPGALALVERFRAGPRRVISIYGPSRLAGVSTGR